MTALVLITSVGSGAPRYKPSKRKLVMSRQKMN